MFHAGSAACNIVIGAAAGTGPVGSSILFWVMGVTGVVSVVVALMIPERAIDARAAGAALYWLAMPETGGAGLDGEQAALGFAPQPANGGSALL